MLYRMEARQNIKLGPRKNMSPDSISISLQKIDWREEKSKFYIPPVLTITCMSMIIYSEAN